MTRQRTKLVAQRTALLNRLHAVLPQGNYKLGQVASNIVRVSGRAILQALSQGEREAAKLAALGQGRLQASWAAWCPGKEQSGNKRGQTRTAKGNRWLKRVLREAAWAATHEQEGYLVALYQRIAPRRGKKLPDHRGGAHDLTSRVAHLERRGGVSGLGRELL
jgi:hypothetical protein